MRCKFDFHIVSVCNLHLNRERQYKLRMNVKGRVKEGGEGEKVKNNIWDLSEEELKPEEER